MKKILILTCFFCMHTVFAQEDAWVYFNDKPNASYFLANPLEMLSQRALDRRTAQNISLDSKDVPVHQPYIDQVTSAQGIIVMAKSKWMNALHIRGSVTDINALTALPFVLSVEFANKNLNARPAAAQRDNTITTTLETAITYNYGTSDNQVQMLNGHLLHQQDYTGTGKIIAVMDSGFPGVNTVQPFQRLVTNNLILGGYNFVQRSENIYTGNFHGTYVLSAMGGYTEGQLVGTAPDAQYYLFITEDHTSENPVEESLWVEAAEMADSLGVDVINTSLGYFNYDNPNYSYTYNDIDGNTAFMTRGANIAFTRGMVLVNSGGNSGATANPNITVPGDAFNTLTVGAVDNNEVIAPFSSVGPSFDGRVKPDIVAKGVAATVSNIDGSIITSNGTSFSSPITAGLVACLWQALPDKTNLEIVQLVRQSANRFTNPDTQYGYGVPDFALALQTAMGIEMPERQNLLIYPNPAHTVINILLPDDMPNATVTIFNTLGQMVTQQGLGREASTIKVGDFATGIYTYRIEAGNRTETGKIIKQ